MFGTDGIRCKVNQQILTQSNLIQLGKAIGAFVVQLSAQPRIFIGHDTRESCHGVLNHLLQGLLQYPVRVEHCKVVATPVIAKLTTLHQASLGLVISASHNSFLYNGIKFMTAQGKLTEQQEAQITTLYQTNLNPQYATQGTVHIYTSALQEYQAQLKTHFKPNMCKDTHIVIDCAHGATSHYATEIFESFGARVTSINDCPDGKNINSNCGIMNPNMLQEYMHANSADIGFCFDGDGDRLYAITANGTCKNGDDIAYLLQTKNPTYQNQTCMVGTVMSNTGLEQYYKNKNMVFVRTPVGDKHISNYLQQHNNLLGAEPSGHIICADWSFCSDSIYTALKLLQTVMLTQDWLCSSFTKFYQVTKNLPVVKKKNLNLEPYRSLLYEFEQKLDPGRLIVRYSGTEHVLRITAEGTEQYLTQAVVNELYTHLTTLL